MILPKLSLSDAIKKRKMEETKGGKDPKMNLYPPKAHQAKLEDREKQEFADFKKDPHVFHMCWTASKVNKLKYMKQVGHWYLRDTCNEESLRASDALTADALRDCCNADADPWRPGGNYPSLAS